MESAFLHEPEYQELWIKAISSEGEMRTVGCILGYFSEGGKVMYQESSTLFVDSGSDIKEILLLLAVDAENPHAKAVVGALRNAVPIGEAFNIKVYLFAPTPYALEVAQRQNIQEWEEGLQKMSRFFKEEASVIVN